MTTHIAIDDALIDEARTLGHFETKEDTVITALREFINRRKQQEIIRLFGTLDSDPDYDYKQGRNA
jgi:Arc/MetJ family transcription regulator